VRRRRLARRRGTVLRAEPLEARLALSGAPASFSAVAGLESGFGSVSPGWFATVAAFSGVAAAAPASMTGEALDASEPAGDARPSPQGAGWAGGVPWIVRLAESAVADVRTVAGAAEFLESAMPGVTVVRGLGLPGQLLVDVGATVAETADLGSLFAAVPGVAWAHPDFQIDASLTPNDPLYGSLYGLHNAGQSGGTAGADIDTADGDIHGTYVAGSAARDHARPIVCPINRR